MPVWWTHTAVDEYVSKAAALTQDLPRLAALRAGLRQRMLQVRVEGVYGLLVYITAKVVGAACFVTVVLAPLQTSNRQCPPVQSPLCDAPTFVRQLEDVYHQLWQRWLDEQQD